MKIKNVFETKSSSSKSSSSCELRIHWRLSTILEKSNRYVKLCIFWKCFQYTLHRDKTQILKKFPSDKIDGTTNVLFFLSQAPIHKSFTSNLRSSTVLLLKFRVRFSIFYSISFFWKLMFLLNKMHGLFDFKTS